MDYKDLVNKLHKLQGINTSEFYKYEDYVEQTFKNLIKSLQTEFVKFRDQYEQVNASPRIAYKCNKSDSFTKY